MLVEASSVAAVEKLIAKLADVPEVRMFIDEGESAHDYIDVQIMLMVKGGNHAGGKGRTSVEVACNELQSAIDSGALDPGSQNDAEEEFLRLNCEAVLKPGGAGGGGLSPDTGWPDLFGGIWHRLEPPQPVSRQLRCCSRLFQRETISENCCSRAGSHALSTTSS